LWPQLWQVSLRSIKTTHSLVNWHSSNCCMHLNKFCCLINRILQNDNFIFLSKWLGDIERPMTQNYKSLFYQTYIISIYLSFVSSSFFRDSDSNLIFTRVHFASKETEVVLKSYKADRKAKKYLIMSATSFRLLCVLFSY